MKFIPNFLKSSTYYKSWTLIINWSPRYLVKYLLIVIAIFSFQSCAHSQVYKVDEDYFFRVTTSDSLGLINKCDTFKMKVTNSLKLAVLGLQKAEWTNLATGEKELRGITNNSKTIEIEPENAYGDVNPQLMSEIPLSQVPEGVKTGDMLQGQNQLGPVNVVVREIKESTVVLDMNHPLAGKKLIFDLEVVSVN
jgi:hypothetical protein